MAETKKRRPEENDYDYIKRLKHNRKVNKYRKKNVHNLNLYLNIKYDMDIIEWLDSLAESKSAYIKSLIREDIKKCKS